MWIATLWMATELHSALLCFKRFVYLVVLHFHEFVFLVTIFDSNPKLESWQDEGDRSTVQVQAYFCGQNTEVSWQCVRRVGYSTGSAES